MKRVVVLGATGSIGRQTLEVAAALGLPIVGLAASRGSEALLELAAGYPDARVAVAAPTAEEKEALAALGGRCAVGAEAVVELAALPETIVVNGIVGSAGLLSSAAALVAGNRLALANKESMVAGGPVLEALQADGGEIVPVDSEHSALLQLLAGVDADEVERAILTASGGPFRGFSRPQLEAVTPEAALHHPTWDMGPRITIDSATLMNKALEVIEAHFLFGLGYDSIDVVVHPQSLVHAMVELADGSLLAHMGAPDMRTPIRYALTHPLRSTGTGALPLGGTTLTFEQPDTEAFPCLLLGYEAGRAGGSAPAVLNAADEIAVRAFLDRRIGFTSIPVVVERTLEQLGHEPLESVDHVLAVDAEARSVASAQVGSC